MQRTPGRVARAPHSPSIPAPVRVPGTKTVKRAPWRAFLASPKGITFVVTGMLVLVASGVIAAVLWTQDVSFTNASQDSDISFVDGGGGVLNFAEVTIGSSGASASLDLSGVAGAANFQVTDLLQIQNSDGSQAYSITLARDAAPNVAITQLLFTVLDGATPVRTFDAATSSSAAAFTLPAGETYDIRIDMAIADGTAAGALGSMDLQFTIAPV